MEKKALRRLIKKHPEIMEEARFEFISLYP